MKENITWVGMDAHKDFVNVAVLPADSGKPVEWRVVNEPQEIRKLARKLMRLAPGGKRGEATKRRARAFSGARQNYIIAILLSGSPTP